MGHVQLFRSWIVSCVGSSHPGYRAGIHARSDVGNRGERRNVCRGVGGCCGMVTGSQVHPFLDAIENARGDVHDYAGMMRALSNPRNLQRPGGTLIRGGGLFQDGGW